MSTATTELAFVSSDRFGKPKNSERRLIRSHCRKGKNLRIGVTQSVDDDNSRSATQATARRRALRRGPQQIAPWLCPPLFDPFPIAFSAEIDSSSRMLIYDGSLLLFSLKLPTTNHPSIAFAKPSNAVGTAGLNVDFDIDNALAFQWLLQDAAYLHCVLFCNLAVNDAFTKTPLRHEGRHHLGKTILLLHDRLDDRTSFLLDSTISIVLSLVIVSSVLGDTQSSATHLMGLQKMVYLRGGLDVFRKTPRLFDKLARLVFSI